MYSAKQFGIKVISKNNDEELCICPFHDDKNASATFNTKKGLFYCFVCQTGLTAKQLNEKMNLNVEIYEDVLEDFWNEIFSEKEIVNRIYGKSIYHPYLEKRKISKEVAEKHYLEFSESEEAILIPIYNFYGNRIGCQLRNVSKGWRYKKIGESTIVYPIKNLLLMDHSKIAFIVEGVFSMMRFETVYKGDKIVPFTLFGARTPKKLLQCFNGFNVIIRYDNDKAGIYAANKASGLYPYYTVTYGESIDNMEDHEILELIGEIENEI